MAFQRSTKCLGTILLKCLRKDAVDRYGTAEALAQDLRRFVRGDPIEARPQPAWERLVSRLKKHRVKIAFASTFVALVVVICFLAYRSDRAEVETQTARLETKQAKYDAQRARYEPAVLELLKKIYAGQFSLKVAAGQTPDVLEFLKRGSSMSPITAEDFRSLYGNLAFDPLEEALAKLAAVAKALPEERDAAGRVPLE